MKEQNNEWMTEWTNKENDWINKLIVNFFIG